MVHNNKASELKKITRERYVIFDGAMGTSLQKFDLSSLDFHGHKQINELLSLYYPEYIKSVHDGFIKAGADIIETNTFSANAIVLKHYGIENMTHDINMASARLAGKIARSYERKVFTAGSIGPTDKLPTLGQISFCDMVEGYIPQVEALIESRIDILILETFQDPLGIKAGLYAVQKMMQKHCYYPLVMASVTFSENGLMLLGTNSSAILNILCPYELFSIGINCSLGPQGLRRPLEDFAKHYDSYISFMPNAGLPKKTDGKIAYDLEPDQFARIMKEYAEELNIEILGGCCGTTSEYIRELNENLKSLSKQTRKPLHKDGVSSLYKGFGYEQEPAPFIIGERTNTSGSRIFADIVKTGEIDRVASFCKEYSQSGMHAIDLFIKTSKKISPDFLEDLVKKLSTMLTVSLCLDCKDIEVIRQILKIYPGRLIINSASLKEGEGRLMEYLEMTKMLGASIILLAIDESNMAINSKDKIKIFSRMISLAKELGLKSSQLILDPLTFSIVSGDSQYHNSAHETLNTIKTLKKRYPEIPLILGVSNISYGVKEDLRKLINSVFLYEAVSCGLDLAIINSSDIVPVSLISKDNLRLIQNLIYNKDDTGSESLRQLLAKTYESSDQESKEELSAEEELYQSILKGNSINIRKNILKLVESGTETKHIIDEILISAIREVGRLFKDCMIPLPFVLESAQAMKEAFSVLMEYMPKEKNSDDKKFIIATVKGDIHDIGKNLVDIIVSSHGYEVINLGTEVDIDTIMENIKGSNYYLGLSGLINESLDVMEDYVKRLSSKGINIPVILGGAAVSKDFVANTLKKKNSNVYYGRDPFDAVKLLEGNLPETEYTQQIPSQKPTARKIDRHFLPDHKFPQKNAILTIKPGISQILKLLDINTLVKARWKYLKGNSTKELFDQKTLKIELDKYIKDIEKNNVLKPAANYSYTSVIREGDALHIIKNNKKVVFEREGFSFIDYFKEGKEDTAIFYCLTVGKGAKAYKDRFFKEARYRDYHLINGLISHIIEAFLIYLSIHIAEESLLDSIEGISPLRLAYGYPYCPKLAEQEKTADLLDISGLGISFTEIYQLNPEESSSGFILPFVLKN